MSPNFRGLFAGRQRLVSAILLWCDAQQSVEAALGPGATFALNGLLDLSATKLTTSPEAPTREIDHVNSRIYSLTKRINR